MEGGLRQTPLAPPEFPFAHQQPLAEQTADNDLRQVALVKLALLDHKNLLDEIRVIQKNALLEQPGSRTMSPYSRATLRSVASASLRMASVKPSKGKPFAFGGRTVQRWSYSPVRFYLLAVIRLPHLLYFTSGLDSRVAGVSADIPAARGNRTCGTE